MTLLPPGVKVYLAFGYIHFFCAHLWAAQVHPGA